MGAQRLSSAGRAFHLPATSREQLRQCSTATFSNRIPSHRAPYRSDTAAPRCSIAFPLPVVVHSPCRSLSWPRSILTVHARSRLSHWRPRLKHPRLRAPNSRRPPSLPSSQSAKTVRRHNFCAAKRPQLRPAPQCQRYLPLSIAIQARSTPPMTSTHALFLPTTRSPQDRPGFSSHARPPTRAVATFRCLIRA